MKRLACAFLITLLGGLSTKAGTNEIKGFVYHSCKQSRCVEVKAARAWLSQGDGSFVTDGPTVVSLLESGRVHESYNGTDAISQPALDTITLERSAGVVLFNLRDGKAEIYGGGRK